MRILLDYIREGRCYIVLLAVLSAASLWVMSYVVSPVGGDISTLVVIPKGVTAVKVSKILAENGLIRFPWSFTLMTRATATADKIKPGAYKLSAMMSVGDILEKLTKGEVAAVWVTIPEGYTARQAADKLAEKASIDRNSFLVAAYSRAKDFNRILDIPSYAMEGYLFPDTYLVPVEADAQEVIGLMIEAFKSKVAEPFADEVAKIAADNSPESNAAALHRVVIVASMIEREAKTPQDRPLISAVIWNRLRLGMKLEIDATVQYAHGNHRPRLYYRDLELDSPYNTYLYAGLTPGPISNPGLDSIEAALHPAKSNYLYYVARADGSHVFSRTVEQHNAAKKRIRNGRP
ncbi:MAG: endolytic transglycosylase MltG [Armatimonadetes bacterium]|nr:endolytic transglycosylase MltG [Armatimonadota bacterium]